jgi:hypothetical protein
MPPLTPTSFSASETTPGAAALVNAEELITELNPFDVLMGRGAPHADSTGNTRLRDIVRDRRLEYVAARQHKEKNRIAGEIIGAVHEACGRFLNKIDDRAELEALEAELPKGKGVVWRVVQDYSVLLAKVKQLLRDLGPEAREKRSIRRVARKRQRDTWQAEAIKPLEEKVEEEEPVAPPVPEAPPTPPPVTAVTLPVLAANAPPVIIRQPIIPSPALHHTLLHHTLLHPSQLPAHLEALIRQAAPKATAHTFPQPQPFRQQIVLGQQGQVYQVQPGLPYPDASALHSQRQSSAQLSALIANQLTAERASAAGALRHAFPRPVAPSFDLQHLIAAAHRPIVTVLPMPPPDTDLESFIRAAGILARPATFLPPPRAYHPYHAHNAPHGDDLKTSPDIPHKEEPELDRNGGKN